MSFQPDERSFAHRNGFSDLGLSLFWMVGAFFLFQIAGLVAAITLLMIFGDPGALIEGDPTAALQDQANFLFAGNSIGQITFLGIATLAITRWHLSANDHRSHYLRLQKTTGIFQGSVLAAVAFIVIQPLVWASGWINGLLPVPESLQALQDSQLEMIQSYISQEGALGLALFHIAVVPAICEEVLFRGYLLRSFERSTSTWIAVLLSGALFGLYHLQLTNMLPLALLGVALGAITVATGSIVPAIVAHFINNAGAVLLVRFAPDSPMVQMGTETPPPLLYIVGSAIGTLILGRMFWNHFKRAKSHATI